MPGLVRVALFVAVFAFATEAASQSVPGVPSEPVTLGGGRVVVGGEVAASIAPTDAGFFNYTNYEVTTIRQLRLAVSGRFRLTEQIAVLGEVRSDNLQHVEPFALYARVRPFPGRRIDVQLGRIPPTFGSFSRRAYSHDNPLIGYPLAYQYLTSLRADAAPADAEELLRMRGRGWLSSFSVGKLDEAPGVPLVSAFTWDTGVQVTSAWNVVTVAAAVTNGTASNPRVSDDNAGKQVAARLTAQPLTGLIVGGSFARGEFLSRRVRAVLEDGRDASYAQRAYGGDFEYSRDHWIVRAETVVSEWQMPLLAADRNRLPLRALATTIEGRYTFLPGVYGAARVDHLGFSRIAATARVDEWDAPVTRVEVGGGYYLQRNLIARVSVQRNQRDGGRVRSATFVAGQLLYWF
jgi:hypothetical protein